MGAVNSRYWIFMATSDEYSDVVSHFIEKISDFLCGNPFISMKLPKRVTDNEAEVESD
jgi:hypothetical protein